ncbi:carbon-nitrogen hydrolase family protein [Paracoccus seriniphilus]|uniref:carbon-nitrogen hydrolase family protein n=1 Tax=Paracoccus seriniphilus TaxID=184748 RepID=UPI003568C916
MKIAAAAYPFDWFDGFSEYEAKITRWVEAAEGADLLVFPEYGAMELASLGGRDVAGDLQLSLIEVARHADRVRDLHRRLSRDHDCVILGASGPYFGAKRPVNRAALYASGELLGVQDKQVMTRFEREDWDVVGGQGLRVFETSAGRIGILICYDSEFPLLGRVLAEAEVEILLVPSCTDTVAGFNRVRIGAMARALEGQCIVVQAPTVGDCAWNPAIDENRGRAAIYGPPDGFWPEDGVIAQGEMDRPGWVTAEVDLSRVAQSRREGAVLPYAHWPETLDARRI